MALLQGPALAIAPVLAMVPIGMLVDRYSRARLLLLFAVANVMATIVSALAANFAVLFIARCLVGLSHTGTYVAAFSMVAELYPAEKRGRASMVLVVGQFGGMAAAFALGGLVLADYQDTVNDWRATMLWLSLPLVVLTAALLRLREPSRSFQRTSEARPGHPVISRLWKSASIVAPIITGCFLSEVVIGGALAWAAPVFSRNFRLPVDRLGAMMSAIVLLSGTIGSVAGGILSDLAQRRGGPPQTLATISLLVAASLPASLFPVVSNVDVAAGLLMLLITVICAVVVMTVTAITIVLPEDLRSTSLSLLVGLNTLFGVALAPLIVSFLSDKLGGVPDIGRALCVVCAGGAFLSTVSFLIAGSTVKKRLRLSTSHAV